MIFHHLGQAALYIFLYVNDTNSSVSNSVNCHVESKQFFSYMYMYIVISWRKQVICLMKWW